MHPESRKSTVNPLLFLVVGEPVAAQPPGIFTSDRKRPAPASTVYRPQWRRHKQDALFSARHLHLEALGTRVRPCALNAESQVSVVANAGRQPRRGVGSRSGPRQTVSRVKALSEGRGGQAAPTPVTVLQRVVAWPHITGCCYMQLTLGVIVPESSEFRVTPSLTNADISLLLCLPGADLDPPGLKPEAVALTAPHPQGWLELHGEHPPVPRPHCAPPSLCPIPRSQTLRYVDLRGRLGGSQAELREVELLHLPSGAQPAFLLLDMAVLDSSRYDHDCVDFHNPQMIPGG